ncbi:hypothetical protein CTDIVETGP_2173 [Clostridium tyrobutyricum DIVETGP]|uniref:Uncharacterized protein n=1 Tax=Clostridium tyrobutyricum DIVETGP TaxID=1408889 RepID=W6N637_CLOTY|nr:hypothetical protein CTDIVETGP_2173 [Clostridium tyrobutyricum DIVETGP]
MAIPFENSILYIDNAKYLNNSPLAINSGILRRKFLCP